MPLFSSFFVCLIIIDVCVVFVVDGHCCCLWNGVSARKSLSLSAAQYVVSDVLCHHRPSSIAFSAFSYKAKVSTFFCVMTVIIFLYVKVVIFDLHTSKVSSFILSVVLSVVF